MKVDIMEDMNKSHRYTILAKILDAIFHPIMWALAGFTKDSIQRTHFWNNKEFTDQIEEGLGLQIIGKEKSSVKQNNWGLFHMPIFGGWKYYVILERDDGVKETWYIGWEYKKRLLGDNSDRRKTVREVSLIPLKDSVKVLSGPGHKRVRFFGIDTNGKQIKLKQVGHGINGDMKYKEAPFL